MYHYHNVYCPHCGDVACKPGCDRNGCSFSQSWQTEEEVPSTPYHGHFVKDWTCPGCGRRFWYLDGREPEVIPEHVNR